MNKPLTEERIQQAYGIARQALLDARCAGGHWVGELSTSALSTATAVMALEVVRRDQLRRNGQDPQLDQNVDFDALTGRGLRWLAEHQNSDGGWGDTTKSFSNISTTMLAHAVFHACGRTNQYQSVVDKAQSYIGAAGGVEAVIRRYGRDKTFSIPILTHCALAGLVDWKQVAALPFELACLPPRFYKTVRLPVVSYALPALIAIGQVRHYHHKPANPLLRLVRRLAIRPTLKRLEAIQPENGGFLEAAPLTSFVTMSLAGMGLSGHPVAQKGLQFLLDSVRPDGSWPIDTNLATWVTTLSVNALGDDLPDEARSPIHDWLLAQQYREVHPYTNADPGGWAWTDLPGGVPDADDTPGAVLALLNLCGAGDLSADERNALTNAAGWLLDLQNRDGGWPTFCRGWGALPFDRSAGDLTAHAIRALAAFQRRNGTGGGLQNRIQPAIERGFKYLAAAQRADGSWLPLWFGNQSAPDDENPVYGTARVLAAYRDTGRSAAAPARRGLEYLKHIQNADGGWGGAVGIESSVEETALAAEILVSLEPDSPTVRNGAGWLLDRVEAGTFTESTPIGFYFARLWYFEVLYPLIFTAAALRRACRHRDALVEPTGVNIRLQLQREPVSG